VELNKAPFHLSGTIASAIETVEPLARQKQITITQEADWAGTVFADEAKVRQILLNLLSNAIKFTPEGGRVTVASRSEASMLFLSVADTGPGIPVEDQRRIFDEFEQLESGRAVNHSGTGLGLALTRRLAELHGGRVWVESEVGQGSCFHVVLPLESALAWGDQEGRPFAGVETAPLVLVVEDNPAAATLLSSMLRQAGYRTQVVRDGEQVVARARELQPLAITLDVLLPGLDGWQVLRALKSTPQTRDIPVIVVSVVDDRSLGIALGADDYLVKPIDRDALLRAVGRHGRPVRPRSRDLKVLVVDPEQETLDRLEVELQPGVTVLKARSGQEGLDLARRHRPDLVLLDLLEEGSGGATGFEMSAALRADPHTSSIPILGITGDDEPSEADRERLKGRVDATLADGEEGTRHLLRTLRHLQQSAGANGSGGNHHVSSHVQG
jgi:CheY-like chemotaxis protein/anti-sigma regulatory factor (Ser/Thr protein kinase)